MVYWLHWPLVGQGSNIQRIVTKVLGKGTLAENSLRISAFPSKISFRILFPYDSPRCSGLTGTIRYKSLSSASLPDGGSSYGGLRATTSA